MLDYCVYLFYRAGIAILGALPLPVLFGLGQFSGTIAWLILPQYRALAHHNIRIAFGEELTPRQRRRLVRRHFQTLSANLLCSIRFNRAPMEKILRRLKFENFEVIEKCFREKRSFVLLLSHVGPWELCTRIFPHFSRGQPLATVYQRIRNPHIDRHVRESRSRFGLDAFDRAEGFGKAIGLLRSGGAIGVLCDQHAGDSGLWTPFFGRLASTTTLPALLARRSNAELISFAVQTDGFARWRAIAESPIAQTSASVNLLTALGNEILEQQVRRNPEDWFWVHNRWKTPRPNFLLERYKRGVFVRDVQKLKPFRILVRSSNWLGDACMSVPAIREIKRGRPDAHVIIASPEKLKALWKIVPEVDEIIALPSKSVFSSARLLRRQTPFDAAVLFPNSLRSALEIWFAVIPRRVGFAGHWRRALLNQAPRANIARGVAHQTYKYLELAGCIGANVRAEFPSANSVRKNGERLTFALCPGAEYGPAKRWLADRFAEVAKEIAPQVPVHWIIFGTHTDTAVAAEIANLLGDRCTNRSGLTTLEQLIDELRVCDLLVTNDTGTMHLAALLQVPTVSIFGSTEPKRTGPLGAGHRILRHHVECSPCFLRECPLDFRCMKAITVDEVKATILQIANDS